MATYYLVGASGLWQGGTIWATSSGGTAAAHTPLSTDDVVFDVHSIGTVTVGTASNCRNLTMTSPGAATITMASTAVLNIFGSLICAAGLTWLPNAAAKVIFSGTTAGLTANFVPYTTQGLVQFNGSGGTYNVSGGFTAAGGITIGIGSSSPTVNFDANTYNGNAGNGFAQSGSSTISSVVGTTFASSLSSAESVVVTNGSVYNLTASGASGSIGLGVSGGTGQITFLSGGQLTAKAPATFFLFIQSTNPIPFIFKGLPTFAYSASTGTTMTIGPTTVTNFSNTFGS